MSKNKVTRGNIFQHVISADVPQSRFNLSHESKLTCDMGKLIPISWLEALPGDKFNINLSLFLRLQPLVAPIMHNIDVNVRWFFVPNRLIWDEWENFITGGTSGLQNPVHPYLVPNVGSCKCTLADYLGLPNHINGNAIPRISALPFRAYNLIYNEYFRDQNLQDELPVHKNSGIDAPPPNNQPNSYILQNVCWEKDYFTSALPWTQRGTPSTIKSTVIYKNSEQNVQLVKRRDNDSVVIDPENYLRSEDSQLGLTYKNLNVTNSQPQGVYIDPNGTLKSLITINELREANAIQRFLERQAVGGARYAETILNHFGIRPQDSRLQRPEYLGGGKSPIVISDVAQNSSTDDITPQGNLAGKGTSSGYLGFEKPYLCTEHGIIMGLMYIRPKTSYSQGVPRQFLKEDKYDYAFPEFANLGEQEVKLSEIDGTVKSDGTFGYQSRYAEYKYKSDEVHGEFRDSLNFWHLGRFMNSPLLNSSFVKCEPRTNIFAVPATQNDSCLVEIYNQVDAIRPLPAFGTPTL